MERIKVIISHPTGNANVRAIAESLAQHKMLYAFYTCIAAFPKNIWYRLGNLKPLSELKRRSFSIKLKPFTHLHPVREIGRTFALKAGLKNMVKHETGFFSVDKVYRSLDKHVSIKLFKNKDIAVYAYEDGALDSFKKAKTLQIPCLYDLPIGYWRSMRQLLQDERQNRPDWAITLTGFQDSDAKINNKDQEIAMADYIFVASSFTKKTLESYPGKLAPVHVIPYGFPPVYKGRTYVNANNRKIKILFVGGLSQRKGIANVIEAADYLKDKVELTVVGRKAAEGCIPLEEGLSRHKWIQSLSHDKILEIMREHDVLVFPSLFEGYGLVITEAMSQGTPVITTDRTCASDIIIDNETGWLVEAGNTDSLIKKLEYIIADPNCIEKVGKAAMAFAETLPMDTYGDKMVSIISNLKTS